VKQQLLTSLLLMVTAVAFASGGASDGGASAGGEFDDADGHSILKAAVAKQLSFPAVFERLSMILVDARSHRETRKLRRYSRYNADGSGKLLLLLDSPSDVAGVALLAAQDPDGEVSLRLYLPALGGQIIETRATVITGEDAEENAGSDLVSQRNPELNPVLGSDFSIEDLSGENLDRYRYERLRDRSIDGSEHYQIAVYNKADDPQTAIAVKRHFVDKDRLVITRTDFFDEFAELSRQLSAHDLQLVSPGVWQPNLLMLKNMRTGNLSMIKIEERVFSADYVPMTAFTIDWLLANHPPLIPAPAANDDLQADMPQAENPPTIEAVTTTESTQP